MLYLGPLKLLNFDFIVDPGLDPGFHSGVDADPASKNNANPDPATLG
jgi:hypothetical protein